MACLLHPHRSGNPAVDALIGTAEKKTGEKERFLPVVIQLCVSGLWVWISVIHIITGVGILKITQHKSKGSNCKTQPSVVTENTLDFFLALLRCTPT